MLLAFKNVMLFNLLLEMGIFQYRVDYLQINTVKLIQFTKIFIKTMKMQLFIERFDGSIKSSIIRINLLNMKTL